ncbi:S41 family peptidase [Pedobacter metabolipauper]|uniref:Peptidase S41-like protein n=1 Tax=Pedobacter metabolipauper TaxID=425513 RepID=A0A4R6SUR5_9SPHI|nr:S41 family peptidase [Pedobacter metabolipauper]TDQ08161.1 peptidase S41-like protein [Pedobacter metabolipauper]
MRYDFKHYALYAALVIPLTFSACKKNKTAPVTPPVTNNSNTKQTATTDRTELTNDSLFLYAKEIYFWNESLPSYDDFEPRKYKTLSTPFENYKSNLFNIVKVSGSADYVSSSTSSRYSYIQDITLRNPDAIAALPGEQASVDLEGNGNDVGIYAISPVTKDNVTYKLYILAVSQNSPAGNAGLTRGAYITRINGVSIGSVANFNTERNTINSTIYGDPATLALEGYKIDGTTFSITLNKTSYKSSPVYKTNVLTAGTKKIGYLSYGRFSNTENSVAALNAVFADFVTKGVTDLVIDLRYNGGGYVSTAEHLINLIAPSSATGTMYVEHFNNTLKNRKLSDATILSNQPLLDANDKVRYGSDGKMLTFANVDYSVSGNTALFSKKGGLSSIQNVVFIVSGGTASASELVINSLKPKMNVKLVGKTTYGKPIGFFPIRLENRYDVYMSLFETKNSMGEGGYYTGIVPDVDGLIDYGDYDFGNPSDGYLAKALDLLAPGVTAIGSLNRVMSVSDSKGSTTPGKLLAEFENDKEFVGMIEDRYKIKK